LTQDHAKNANGKNDDDNPRDEDEEEADDLGQKLRKQHGSGQNEEPVCQKVRIKPKKSKKSKKYRTFWNFRFIVHEAALLEMCYLLTFDICHNT
jgi:hypothetical protein